MLGARVVVRWADVGDARAGSDELLRATVGEVLHVAPGAVLVARRCPRCGADDHGRPLVRVGTEAPAVSVARSAGRAIVAVAPGARGVGVDLERVGSPLPARFADVVLAPGEAVADDLGLLEAWVRKEATLKASGRGLLDVDLADLSLEGPQRPVVRVAAVDVGEGWVAAVARRGRRAVSVAVR